MPYSFRSLAPSFALVLSIFSVCTLPMGDARAQSAGDTFDLSPFWDWQTLNTEHFRITFPKELEKQSQRVAQIYEEAYKLESAELKWEPGHRVQVLLTDQTDSANGLTTPLLRFGMILYLTPPETWFSTTYYDDWLKLLIYHEFTHYLNMDTTRGFWSVTRYIFGDVLLPNSLWPTWMLEGLAVFNETKFTRVGRGRSPYFEMLTRAAVEKNLLDDSAYITLDQVNGEHPMFPGGETPYFFGYQLMNQVEKTLPNAVGEMSYRSGNRFPYLINGNLSNITGKDWYDYWREWVEQSRVKATKDLEAIRKNPVTPYKVVNAKGYDSMGAAINGRETLLAYSGSEQDKWQSLYLKDLETGETERIEDKFLGVGMSFHPTEPVLVYSSLSRDSQYYFYSDLRAYDVKRRTSYALTEGARAKDPDVSRDGRYVVYTTNVKSTNALSMAVLRWSRGELHVDNVKNIYLPPMLDRVGNPKFSPDGKYVVFSYKRNGAIGEELRRYDMKTGKIEVLLADRSMNRFPTFAPNGLLYFVSDRTGVDNVYRLEGFNTFARGLAIPRPVPVTNTTTGFWLPAVSMKHAFVSVFEPDGWKIAEVELHETKVNSVSPAEAPKAVLAEAPPAGSEKPYAVEPYSAWSTLAPRQWSPILLNSKYTTQIGGEILGYDAVLRHSYFLLGDYDTQTKQGDLLVAYENRSFGPTLSLVGIQETHDVNRYANGADYLRKTEGQAAISFPFRGDVSIFTPRLATSLERDKAYTFYNGERLLTDKSRYVPTEEATLNWDNTRASRWAVAPETGRRILVGAKRYDDSDRDTYKGIAKWNEYFHFGKNVVLSPSAKGLFVSKYNNRFGDANGDISGRENRVYNPFGVDDFDQFYVRGYADRFFNARRAYTGALDLKFPVAQIFRGWGTNPFFLDQLTMNTFAETTYVPEKPPALAVMPSAGVGLHLNTEVLLHLPFSIGVDYQYGFNKARRVNGAGDLFFSLAFSSALPFGI